MTAHPVSIPWNQAPPIIADLARTLCALHRVVIIGITGPVGAGKSTLAAALSPCVISTDHYLPDYDTLPEHERDLPDHADFQRLSQDLATLKAQRPTSIPQWSFHTHKREGERTIQPHHLVVVEGIHALHDRIESLLDLRIFVDAPRLVRWQRWEYLESTGQRGWGVEKARDYFHRVAEVTFARYEEKYRARADVVVINQ